MKESQRMPFYRRELVLSTYTEHRAILDALKARDSAAAGKAIETHITNAAQRAGVYFPTAAGVKKPLRGAVFFCSCPASWP